MRRYELRSVIMTSNRPLEEWRKLIADAPTYPFKPSNAIRIFSSAENFRRVWRRISFTADSGLRHFMAFINLACFQRQTCKTIAYSKPTPVHFMLR